MLYSSIKTDHFSNKTEIKNKNMVEIRKKTFQNEVASGMWNLWYSNDKEKSRNKQKFTVDKCLSAIEKK